MTVNEWYVDTAMESSKENGDATFRKHYRRFAKIANSREYLTKLVSSSGKTLPLRVPIRFQGNINCPKVL